MGEALQIHLGFRVVGITIFRRGYGLAPGPIKIAFLKSLRGEWGAGQGR
jgi:hypothetical protein